MRATSVRERIAFWLLVSCIAWTLLVVSTIFPFHPWWLMVWNVWNSVGLFLIWRGLRDG